ncbi:MAG TPA: hypothetical protein PL169_28740, partial [Leptospiraceae bacterium]|nr:hypothetical protein [Leptospiraceae bacterium]
MNRHSDKRPDISAEHLALAEDEHSDLQDLESFKKGFIEENRGRPIFLIRFENLQHKTLVDFISMLKKEIRTILEFEHIKVGFYFIEGRQSLLMGLAY